MTKSITLRLIAATLLLTVAACNKPKEQKEEPLGDSMYWKIDGTTYATTPILADCGIDNPYGINVFKQFIYITTDGGYSANGSVYCYNMSGMEMWHSEVGMLPSKVEPYENVNTTNFAYVLCEGLWGNNNASLSTVNSRLGYTTNNVFRTANHRQLGDVAQDIVAYGHKAYVAVTFSNSIEVLDNRNQSSTRIDLATSTPSAKNPRCIAAGDGKIYVTCYDPCSVVRIDTATLQVEAICTLGTYHPEGIALAGGKLIIASSHISDEHSNYTYDDRLYVVDPTTLTIERTITVGTNPTRVVALDDNRVVVSYVGNYTDLAGGTAIVDATTGSVHQLSKALYNIATYDGSIYGYTSRY